MQITVIDVGTPAVKTASTGRQYQEIELMYKDDSGKPATKKIMSFSTDLYRAVQGLQRGAVLQVERKKNEKTGYWDWISFYTGDSRVAEQPTKPTGASPATRVAGSNYETKEERAARQILIVKQSSLSTAVNALAVGAKSAPSAADVIAYAKQLEEYVMGTPQTMDDLRGDEDVVIE